MNFRYNEKAPSVAGSGAKRCPTYPKLGNIRERERLQREYYEIILQREILLIVNMYNGWLWMQGGRKIFFAKKLSTPKLSSGTLSVFDANGNLVARVSVSDNGTDTKRREVGRWNFGNIAEGTYVIRGVLTGKDGSRERVSAVVGVVK